MEESKDTIEMIGAYLPKTKFTEFIGAKGNVNFLSETATIDAKQLSGMYYDDITLKLTIHSDGTVDLDELDTNKTTSEERIRLIQIIEEKTISTFRGRSVVNELMFTSIEKVKDKTIPLYLAVEHQKPIEKLGSLFDDDLEMSNDALNNLDNLLSLWGDLEESDSIEISPDSDEIQSGLIETNPIVPNSHLAEQFSKMKEEKLNELRKKKEKTEDEIRKNSFQLTTTQKLLSDLESELKLLESRIEDLKPSEENNGIYFSVSERQNEEINLDPQTEELIRKTVSKVKSINAEAFMDLFKNGEFHIYLAIKNESGFEKITDVEKLDESILENLSKLDLVFDKDKFIFNGEMPWGEIVNKMTKFGFQQDHEFDLICFPKSDSGENPNSKSSKF